MSDTMTPAPEQEISDVETSPTPDMQGSDVQAPTEPLKVGESNVNIPGAEGHAEAPIAPGQEPRHSGVKGEIEKIVSDYVIPMSDEAIANWAKTSTPEEFKKYAEQVAIGLYPTFAVQIQQGITTRILLDPYIQVAIQVLGAVDQPINWSDPKWSAALAGGIDSKTGRPVPMSLDEWRKHLMSDRSHGWEYSQQAHDRVQKFLDIMHRGFGATQQGRMI